MGIFKKDYIIGLDIGSSSVKLVQFKKKEGRLSFVKADIREVQYTEDEELHNNEKIEILKDLFSGIDKRNSKIVVNVNCLDTMLKRIITPYMPKAELKEGIILESKNYFPLSLKDAEMDFEISDVFEEKEVKKYKLLAAVSPKDTIHDTLFLLNKAGIKPASLVPFSYSFKKYVEASLPGNTVKTFIDIGERYSELIILKGKDLLFSRKIPVTGIDFTKAMTGVLMTDTGKTQLTIEEAEKIKCENGIPVEYDAQIADGKISAIQILSMIRPLLEQLVSEINRCFDYYSEGFSGGKIDSVMLFGGGAQLKGLREFLARELEIEVSSGVPLTGFDTGAGDIEGSLFPDESFNYKLVSAIGAALSCGEGINLLPPEVREKIQMIIKRAAIQAAAAAIILVLVFIYIEIRMKITNFQKRIDVSKMEMNSLSARLKILDKQNILARITNNNPNWTNVLLSLSKTIPREIHLSEFIIKDKSVTMKGIVQADMKEAILLGFVNKLGNGVFEDVKFITTKEVEKQTVNDFELTCRVK